MITRIRQVWGLGLGTEIFALSFALLTDFAFEAHVPHDLPMEFGEDCRIYDTFLLGYGFDFCLVTAVLSE